MKQSLREHDVYPSNVLRDDYGFNAENRPVIKVNQEEVPEAFRPLIPYVERWAIPCDVTRVDYFDKQPPEDVADFYYSALPLIDEVQKWISAQPKDVSQWSDAAVHFLYFLEAHSEAYQPTDNEIREREERFKEWEHKRRMEQAVVQANTAFLSKDYHILVELLSPFEEKLDKVWRAKLVFARKKVVPSQSQQNRAGLTMIK